MGYVGCRWAKFGVLPTPERLEEALRLVAVFAESPVPRGSAWPTGEEVVARYREFLDKRAGRGAFFLASEGTPFQRQPCGHGDMDSVEPEKPVVNLGVGDLWSDGKGLSALLAGTPAYLQFSFAAAYAQGPSWQTWPSDGSPNRRLYDALRQALSEGTRPLVVVGPNREWRLPVRYAPDLRDWIAAHPVLAANGLRVK